MPKAKPHRRQDYKRGDLGRLSRSRSVEYSWTARRAPRWAATWICFWASICRPWAGSASMEQLMSVKAGTKGSATTHDEQNASRPTSSSSSQTVADRLELPRYAREVPRVCRSLAGVSYRATLAMPWSSPSLADVYIKPSAAQRPHGRLHHPCPLIASRPMSTPSPS